MSKQVVHGKSDIAGHGLFAGRAIPAGEFVKDQYMLDFKHQIGFNHSCDANVTTVAGGYVYGMLRETYVVALRDISEGEELTLNYYRHEGGGAHEQLRNGVKCNCPLHREDKRC